MTGSKKWSVSLQGKNHDNNKLLITRLIKTLPFPIDFTVKNKRIIFNTTCWWDKKYIQLIQLHWKISQSQELNLGLQRCPT